MALDEASFAARTGRRYGCVVADIIATLDEADRATFQKVLDSKVGDKYTISHQAVANTMRSAGYPLGQTSVQKHRSGGCRCRV